VKAYEKKSFFQGLHGRGTDAVRYGPVFTKGESKWIGQALVKLPIHFNRIDVFLLNL
jgi:hypothetical protein